MPHCCWFTLIPEACALLRLRADDTGIGHPLMGIITTLIGQQPKEDVCVPIVPEFAHDTKFCSLMLLTHAYELSWQSNSMHSIAAFAVLLCCSEQRASIVELSMPAA